MDHERETRLSFSDLQDDLSDDGNQSYISSSSSSSFNQDFLGFFSEEWSSTTTSIPSEGIIFCGKVIHNSRNTQIPNPNIKTDSRNNNSLIARRNSDSNFCNGRSSSHTPRSNSFPVSGKKKNDGYKNQSKLACSNSKSRWQVFMFGSDRFPTKKMELSDIRSRQLRRTYGGEEKKSGGKRLWEVIRVLGCGGFNDKGLLTVSG